MRKLSDQCKADVDRYVELRYSHWSGYDRAKRKREVKAALQEKGEADQIAYSEKVEALFQKNAGFLDSCERSKQEALMAERKKISLRDSVAEAIRGNNYK